MVPKSLPFFRGDDLRDSVDVVSKAIALITSCRTYINSSTQRTNSLKIICKDLNIRYTIIPVEFEVRFQAWLTDAVEKWVKLLPALYHFFRKDDVARASQGLSRAPQSVTLTDDFRIVAFILRWIAILRLE